MRAAGCVFSEEEAALLLAAASGSELESLVLRRSAGEPLEHLLGWVSFAGARYVVTPGVFIPRRRSELLVSVVHGLLVDSAARTPPGTRGEPIIVELCCGAATIGAAIRARLPDAEVWAADLDPVAVACARRNLPLERVVEGDLYDALPAALRGRIDVVVVNAPYVPTDAIATMPPEARDHEPRSALDGGADGVDLHRRLAAGASEWLAPGGVLLVETSPSQAALTVAAMGAGGLEADVEVDDEVGGCVAVGLSRRRTAAERA